MPTKFNICVETVKQKQTYLHPLLPDPDTHSGQNKFTPGGLEGDSVGAEEGEQDGAADSEGCKDGSELGSSEGIEEGSEDG